MEGEGWKVREGGRGMEGEGGREGALLIYTQQIPCVCMVCMYCMSVWYVRMYVCTVYVLCVYTICTVCMYCVYVLCACTYSTMHTYIQYVVSCTNSEDDFLQAVFICIAHWPCIARCV